MALPGARGAVQLITRHGAKFHAHAVGQKQGIDMAHPEVHVHLRPGVMFDPGDGSPHVDVHDAFHNNPKALPPGLMALIVAAVERYMQMHRMSEGAGGLPGARATAPAPMPSGPPPAAPGIPMPSGPAPNPPGAPMASPTGGGGLPGNRMAA